MTGQIVIPAGERGVLRVFALALPMSDIRRLTEDVRAVHDRAAWLAGLLGVATLDPARVEVFDAADTAEMGLAGYLAEAHAIPGDALRDDRTRLDGLRGPVLILLPGAVGGPATLTPDPRLTLIGAWLEEGAPPVRFEPLPAGGAKGVIVPPATRSPRSDARMGGMLAMLALAVMFALTALVIWIGG
ncbi:MAG: hypothetical protein KF887_18850 [Paracoccaceae bacterium]|nr:MAG: hypothetical protein KF887_18850 [Paracoccaceae bacterium]